MRLHTPHKSLRQVEQNLPATPDDEYEQLALAVYLLSHIPCNVPKQTIQRVLECSLHRTETATDYSKEDVTLRRKTQSTSLHREMQMALVPANVSQGIKREKAFDNHSQGQKLYDTDRGVSKVALRTCREYEPVI